MAESKEELKSFLMKVKEESEKAGLKHSTQNNEDHCIWSNHFMQTYGGTMEKVTDFTFLGSKITAHGDCSNKIKRLLLLRRKAVTNLDSI